MESRISRTVAALLVGGFLLVTDLSPARAASLSAVGDGDVQESAHTLAITVRGVLAEAESTQLLVGPTGGSVEAIYTFELPPAAAVTGLTVQLASGRVATGQIVDADAAVSPPPATRGASARGSADIALLRMIERSSEAVTYELRVYPVAHGKAITVRLHWVAPMTWSDGRLTLRVPGRGNPGNLVGERVAIQAVAAAPVRGWRELRAAGRSVALGGRAGGRLDVTAPAHGDLVVEAAPLLAGGGGRAQLSFAAVPLTRSGGALVLQLAAPPPTGEGGSLDYQRMIAVVDVSRSMGRDGVIAAERLVRELVYALPVSTRLELVLFDRAARRPLGGWRGNDNAGKQAIADALSSANLDNGSDLGAALDAVRTLLDRDDRPGHRPQTTLICLLSDGLTALDVDDAAALHRIGDRAVHDADILAVALAPDDDPLPDLDGGPLTTLAARSGGRAIALHLGETEARAAGLVAELHRPAPLQRLAVEVPAGSSVDVTLPDRIDGGEGAVAIGWYRGAAPAKLALTAVAGGQPVRIAGAGDATLRRWAAALVLAATPPDGDDHDDDGDDSAGGHGSAAADSPGAQQAAAARKAGVVSASTALVVLDPGDALARDRLAMAARWNGAVFFRIAPPGEGDAAARLGYREVADPVGANAGPGRRAGALDRSIIARLIETHVLPRAKICYDRALRTDHQLHGQATLLLEMARGEVARSEVVDSTFAGNGLEACLAEAGWAVQVPRVAAGDGGDTIDVVRYPLRFRLRGNQAEVDRDDRGAVVVDPDAPLGTR